MRRIILAIVLILFAAIADAGPFGDAMAAYNRGDYSEAVRLFQSLAKQGEAGAQFYLGLMYDAGKGVPQDHTEAVRWVRKAAEQGDASAQFYLGIMYDAGKGVPQDDAEAARWVRKAAEQGDAVAQYYLGIMYGKGQGVPQDYAEAVRWYRKAAEQGDADAQYKLADAYHNGQGVPQDHTESARWYRKAAEQGEPYAQDSLGIRYAKGQGIPQDHAEAVRWYRKAAEQGLAVAQKILGVMYAKGQGVPQDYAEAMRWYRKAAEQGDAGAQFNLGISYSKGKGVPQDYAEAVRWYRKAAEQGDASAQNNLGHMYYLGAGVPVDYANAYMWSNLAASSGQAKASELRDDVAKRMTSSQVAEAQRLSRNFVARPEKPSGGSQRQSAAVGDKVSREVVAHVQKSLKAMGYYNSSVDGLIGPKTRAAIKEFQRDSGIPVNGVLDSKLVGQLELLGGLAKKKPSTPELALTGSGFVINQEGYVVTNYHVVDGCQEVKSPMLGSPGVREVATNDGGRNSILGSIVATDQAVDLAVVDLPGNYPYFARFRDNNKVKLGESVLVAGFPLRGLLSDDLNVATGEVSALSGIRDDAKLLQISAPVQTGNSGGPLLDQSGNVIGVVVAKLDAWDIAKRTGHIPQNVNFAVKSAVVRFLLDIHNVDYQTSDATRRIGTAEIAAQARNYTVVLECWK